MLAAMESALKRPTLGTWAWIGLVLCATDSGCARLRSFGQNPPMLGAAAPFDKNLPSGPGSGDLYAQQVGKGMERSRALLAQERAKAKGRPRGEEPADSGTETLVRSTNHPTTSEDGRPRSGEDAPLDVALQPPVTIPTAPPLETASAPAVEAPSDTPPKRDTVIASSANPKPAAPAEGEAKLESILTASREKLESLSNYQVAFKRQERVGGSLQPEEEAMLSIRRQPMAVRLEWPTGSNKGREAIYASGDGDGLLHVKMANSLLPPMALAPDNPLVMSSSRHPITEAGFDNILMNVEKTFKPAPDDAPRGALTYEGVEKPEFLAHPAHKIRRITPTGENWLVYIDTETMFPTLVAASDPGGQLLERYIFETPKVNLPDLASADAFDANKRWGLAKGGFLQRLARAGGSKEPSADTTPR